MSGRDQDREEDAVVQRLAAALRSDVAVRPEWRAAVLRAIDASPPPRRTGIGTSWSGWNRRRWQVSPIAALATAVACVAIGVAGAMALLQPVPHDPGAPIQGTVATRAVAGVRPSASADQSSGGTSVRFVIVAANASRVSLVGDFNGWNPSAMPMERSGDGGAWVREVVLEPGRHVYAFYVDGALQVDPSAPHAAEDDFGIPSSALVVRNASQ